MTKLAAKKSPPSTSPRPPKRLVARRPRAPRKPSAVANLADSFTPKSSPEDYTLAVATMEELTEVHHELTRLGVWMNLKIASALKQYRPRYAELLSAAVGLEALLEKMVRAHPEWFATRKSISTPFGVSKLVESTRLELDDPEVVVQRINTAALVDPELDAGVLVRRKDSPNLETLALLPDAKLGPLGVRRVTTQNFSFKPAEVDLSKASAVPAKA